STVQSATLRLALVQSDAKTDPTYNVSVHKITGKNPTLAKSTGSTADGSTAWSPSKCCYNGIPLAEGDISPAYDTEAIDKTNGYKAWNVTTMVQEWLQDPTHNYGLLLNSDATKSKDRFRTFASMENPNTALRPYLDLTINAADAVPPTVSI